jgi:hypothetical protein
MNPDDLENKLNTTFNTDNIKAYQLKPPLLIYNIYIRNGEQTCLELYYNSYRNYVKVDGLSKCGNISGGELLNKLKHFVNTHYITSDKFDNIVNNADSTTINDIISIDNSILNAINILQDTSYIYIECNGGEPIPINLYNLSCLSKGMSWYNSLGFGQAPPGLLEYITNTPITPTTLYEEDTINIAFNSGDSKHTEKTEKTIKEIFGAISKILRSPNIANDCDYDKMMMFANMINNFTIPSNIQMPSKRNLIWHAPTPTPTPAPTPAIGGRNKRTKTRQRKFSRRRYYRMKPRKTRKRQRRTT